MSLDISNNLYLSKLDKTKPVLLALSGGVDSMVLFDLLLKANFKVIIAHVNHHKREESKMEEAYLRSLAKDLALKIYVFDYYHENLNFQAEAHNSRYDFFYKIAKENNCSAILTAHHAEDNLETILMNLMKGSNLYGYGGIKENTLYLDMPLIRPLIRLTKPQLYDYAKNHNLKYFEDASNQSDDYLRNRVRHHLIPLMVKENNNLYKSIENYSTQVFGAFNLIRKESMRYLKENDNKIKLLSYLKLDLVLQKDIINYLFELNDLESNNNKFNDLLELMNSKKPNLTYDLGNGYTFIKAYDECYLTEEIVNQEIFKELNKYDEIILDDYGSFFFSNNVPENTKYLLKVSQNEAFPLTIRTRKPGDKLIIGEGHKKLKDFLIDKKVPQQLRNKILLIENNQKEIIWVIGYYQKKCLESDSLNLIFKPKNQN